MISRRNFLSCLAGIPFVGFVLPKEYLNDVKTIGTTKSYSSNCTHLMFGQVKMIHIYKGVGYNDVYVTFENKTKAKYKIYESKLNYLDHKYSDEIIEKVCSDIRNIPSEWTYCKNKIQLDNGDELILMSLNIVQPLISGERINSSW
jgi:hypothetical protein